MEVERDQASYSITYQGKPYYFCSEICRTAFEKDPQKYLKTLEKDRLETRKVVVVGAGQVGATFSFALMSSGLASHIILVDIHPELAEGHSMDLNHGLSFVQPTIIQSGDYSECKGADVVVVTAGAAQKEGESRLDLVRKNAGIFKEIIPQITAHDPGILLIVSNPVDVLTYVALKVSGYAMNRVIGSGTSLDTARFRFLLSRHCKVDPRNVHAYIIGEHGDSEVPLWSLVNIAGVPFLDYCPVCGKNCSPHEREDIFKQVKNAAYEIITKKGYTNFAIALALVRIVGSIIRNENSVLTVSTLLDHYHGIKDVCLSIPVILNRNGVFKQVPVVMNETETKALQSSAKTLKEVIDELEI
ncbi:MAG: L-lactate dehydrogenase [Deltaproteobacteria bacterium]|nr:L-lactate dehydrogenase [Deltaproteobacteria bacterium]